MNTLPSGFQVFKDNVYTILTGKYHEGSTSLDLLNNAAVMRLSRKITLPSFKDIPELTAEQKKAIDDFYRPYVRHMDDKYHRLYTYRSGGKFYPEYLPEDFYFMYIDRFYNDRRESCYMDNKCYYSKLFPDTPQPRTVAMRVGKSWLDGSGRLITPEQVKKRILAEDEVVLKQAVLSEGGFGVHFISGDDKFNEFRRILRGIKTDVIIQEPIKQHADMAALNPSSVNTIRIMTWMDGCEVKVLRAMSRIGVGGDRVDNSSHGGVICGIGENGQLTSTGVFHDGRQTDTHPELGYRFGDKRLAYMDKAYELVKNAHPAISHFRLVGWDVAIDENGEAVLVEVNFTLCGINDMQVTCGPLFGDDTKKMLDEVFKGKKAKFSTLL
ncbi:MAG: hypothetical protein II760_05330 [Lachnospiraceae bacterium]|nr:hypothetical protein [Lachnospiraceae bacterium]